MNKKMYRNIIWAFFDTFLFQNKKWIIKNAHMIKLCTWIIFNGANMPKILAVIFVLCYSLYLHNIYFYDSIVLFLVFACKFRVKLILNYYKKYIFFNRYWKIEKNVKTTLSTSSRIRSSYAIRATIFEKVFRLEKFPKTKYISTKRRKSLSSRTCKFSSRTCKLCFPPWIHFIEKGHNELFHY